MIEDKVVIIAASERLAREMYDSLKGLIKERPEFLHKEYQLRGVDKRVVLFWENSFVKDIAAEREHGFIKRYLDDRGIRYILINSETSFEQILNEYDEKYTK